MIAVQVGPFCSVCGSMEGPEALPSFMASETPETLLPILPNSWPLGNGMTQSLDQPLPWFLGALGSLHTEEIESEMAAPVPRETGRSNRYCLGMLT